ncbi:MAG: CbiX/SirB N-terminal domain-containing protein [Candidatus Methanomethylophilus sp.]|nr:CbiX/SirB N-terminal domain-containing protein [Methanomethylophilus sp.]MDD4221893.1 CbiX/SirB N-terminal domain-containing protein [Methanomethylophilus sp.]MDD4669187.1 CbiX/SirB N-terminal domain-containing protein [Methanomethylophilus sp.]
MKAILIIAYGSSLPYATETVNEQAERVRSKCPEPVYTAFDRVNAPTIPDALRQMVADGADDVAVLPLFIAEGIITKEHLPAKLGLKEHRSGKVSINGREILIRLGRAVGADPTVPEVLAERARQCGSDANTGVLILGHGSNEPENRSVANTAAAAMIKEFPHVTVCFNEFCPPSIEEGLTKLLGEGCEKITVLPLFIANGLHLREEIPHKLGLEPGESTGLIERGGKKTMLTYAQPIGADPLLAKVLVAEAEQLFAADL